MEYTQRNLIDLRLLTKDFTDQKFSRIEIHKRQAKEIINKMTEEDFYKLFKTKETLDNNPYRNYEGMVNFQTKLIIK